MEKIDIQSDLKSQGFCLLQGLNITDSQWSDLLKKLEGGLESFHKTWEDLPEDNFLSDGGHYRFRRYSVFKWHNDVENSKDDNTDNSNGSLELLPHEPHYQSTYRNNMNGGIYRDFEPFKEKAIESPVLKTLIQCVADQISFNQEKQWRVQAHQFRIVASADEAGNPTPEGIHRDGADFILIMVLERNNITGGVNHIYDEDKRMVFGSVLTEQGDAVLLDDRKVWHGVSEVYPIDESKPAYRDVLVLTFHNQVKS